MFVDEFMWNIVPLCVRWLHSHRCKIPSSLGHSVRSVCVCVVLVCGGGEGNLWYNEGFHKASYQWLESMCRHIIGSLGIGKGARGQGGALCHRCHEGKDKGIAWLQPSSILARGGTKLTVQPSMKRATIRMQVDILFWLAN
jgi:hypothetical protein